MFDILLDEEMEKDKREKVGISLVWKKDIKWLNDLLFVGMCRLVVVWCHLRYLFLNV